VRCCFRRSHRKASRIAWARSSSFSAALGQRVDALEVGRQRQRATGTFVQPRHAVLLPARLLFGRQRVVEVACAVAEQQFFQPPVVEGRLALGGQLAGLQFAQALQRAAVLVADEAAVQVFVHIGLRLVRPGA
jgi:hypothetical protein